MYSLLIDASWRDDVVKAAILCDDGSFGAAWTGARLARVDDLACPVAFAAATALLPGEDRQVAPLGLALAYA